MLVKQDLFWNPFEMYYDVEFLKHPTFNTYVLRITIFKTPSIVYTTDGKVYIRKGAQSLPVDTIEKLRRLELDKGISSYEDEPIIDSSIEDVTEAETFKKFSQSIIPEVIPDLWLKKQRLYKNGKLTVAGEMLFSDEPQFVCRKDRQLKCFAIKLVVKLIVICWLSSPLQLRGVHTTRFITQFQKSKRLLKL